MKNGTSLTVGIITKNEEKFIARCIESVSKIADEIIVVDTGSSDRTVSIAKRHGATVFRHKWKGNFAKARNVSVARVRDAGVLKSAAGKVRLYKRAELSGNWGPETDDTPTVWEATQHLIKLLEEAGEEAAAGLLARLGPMADQARNLAYRLYATCERQGWAEEAQAYNGLVLAWPELEKLAVESGTAGGSAPQAELFE